jgi:pimeloyl-ACP methyl ester carboxylesterase
VTGSTDVATDLATDLDMRSAEFTLATSLGRIAGVIDTMPGNSADGPVVVVPPTFGRTIQDYGVVAWTLAANGFRVVRYDQTCHVGASEGLMQDFSPRNAISDLHAVLDHVATALAPPRVGVVAFSLGFRFALRALAGRHDIAMLLGIGAVVDMRATLAIALREDYFSLLEDSILPATALALGHRVKDTFIADSAGLDLHTLQSASTDAERLQAAVVVIVNELDPWVAVTDIRRALADAVRGGPTELVTVPSVAQHEIQRNPVAAVTALREMVAACRRHLGVGADDAVVPSLPQMARVQRAQAVSADRRLSQDPAARAGRLS